jgi:2-C-methyl-D-erythritol 4-phosphate cytidylyltransferase
VVYAIIPAAGIGTRMQSSIPKQYLPLSGSTVLLHSMRAILALPQVSRLIVALNQGDIWWHDTHDQLSADELERVQICEGGAERWQSVRAGLQCLTHQTECNEWVLIHDAVRPCVRREDLLALLESCTEGAGSRSGGLLAVPVTDTLKRADGHLSVQTTVDRSQLWAACTPQMFRARDLLLALERCADNAVTVTDESSAMEFCGEKPQLIPCHKDNIKITYPEDLQLAEWILRDRQQSSTLSSGA